MQTMSDRVLGLACLAFAGLMAWRTTVIQESFIQDPFGPKAFPFVIATVIAICGVAIFLKPDAEPHWPPLGRLAEILAAVAVMVAYAQFLPDFGFIVCTAVASAILSWRLGATLLSAIVAGVCIALGIYLVFHSVLGLSLAKGRLDWLVDAPLDQVKLGVEWLRHTVSGG